MAAQYPSRDQWITNGRLAASLERYPVYYLHSKNEDDFFAGEREVLTCFVAPAGASSWRLRGSNSCGRAVNSIQVPREPDERCEIQYETGPYSSIGSWLRFIVAGTEGRFFAIATGPSGVYTAGISRTFNYPSGNVTFETGFLRYGEPELNELVNTLIKEGWRPDPHGTIWYNFRFHRSSERNALPNPIPYVPPPIAAPLANGTQARFSEAARALAQMAKGFPNDWLNPLDQGGNISKRCSALMWNADRETFGIRSGNIGARASNIIETPSEDEAVATLASHWRRDVEMMGESDREWALAHLSELPSIRAF